jgi:lysophospholipase L1-like esterase
MQRKWIRAATLWGASLLFCLDLGFPPSGVSSLAAADNARWEFMLANLDVFPGIDKIFEADSRMFWKLRPNLQMVPAAEKLPKAEFPFTISTDRFGRRLIPEVDASRHTVLFLGDSCTFGIPVNDDETYPALLQQRLKQVRCINAAVPGYSSYQGRLILEQWDDPTQRPDVVVITFWPNDRSIWDHLSDIEHAQLVAAEASGKTTSIRLTRLLRRALPGSRPRLNEHEFEREIRNILRWCEQRGATPVLQVWPARRQVESLEEVDRQEILRRIAAQTGVTLVDLVPAVRAQKGAKLFSDTIHMTRDGHVLVASTLQPVLEKALADPKPEAAAKDNSAASTL